MDALQYWLQGFAVATLPMNLLYAFIGCILGTLIGVLPGLGPAAGTAILIPVTFNLDPIGAIIMLAAIYAKSVTPLATASAMIWTTSWPNTSSIPSEDP